jgi:hypothetical protein
MIIAIFAFARAIIWVFDILDDLNEIELNESRPTAITVSRIISDRVTTKANPFSADDGDGLAWGSSGMNFMD